MSRLTNVLAGRGLGLSARGRKRFLACAIAYLVAYLGAMLFFSLFAPAHASAVPRAANAYKLELKRTANRVFGRAAPVPMLAAQIHQESFWRPNVCSQYACGLTQFTPATAAWIQDAYGVELGTDSAQRVNPAWAIRAQARYMQHLVNQLGGEGECDKFSFALSGYNGGPGWVLRDRAQAKLRGRNPMIYESIRDVNAGRAQWAITENRDYVDKIMIKHQPLYSGWGHVVCGGER